MKYAKAYLLVNNLELIANVVKTIPDMTNPDDEQYGDVTLYLTTSIPEKRIREALEVDQILNVQIESISFSSAAEETIEKKSPESNGFEEKGQAYRVETQSLDDVQGFVDELDGELGRIVHTLAKHPTVYGPVARRLKRLTSVIDSLSQSIVSIRFGTLKEEFLRLTKLADDLATRLGKKIEIKISGEDLAIDRRLIDELSGLLIHLVRNSLDHGFEVPEKRRTSGKGEVGKLWLEVARKETSLNVSVRDDGRGISRREVIERAVEMGVKADDKSSLLSLLSRPGFTTKRNPTSLSGRGVGLDLIVDRIRNLGGQVFLDTAENRGTSVHLSLPLKPEGLQLVVFRIGAQTFSLSRRYLREIKNGRQTGNNVRICSLGITGLDNKKPREFALFLGSESQILVLYVDELLFEKDVQEKNIYLDREIAPCVYSVRIDGLDPGYYYIHPSLLDSMR